MAKCFIVLGMHRSATSLAAKGLFKNNVCMGTNLLRHKATNKYGHFEDLDFIHMNDKILASAGGSWDNPPDEDAIIKVGEDNSQTIKDFIKSKERQPFWGWKDPRTTLTIRCYMPYLKNPHFIACYRKPSEVAASLWRRDNMPLEKGLILSEIYNSRMKEFLEEFVLYE